MKDPDIIVIGAGPAGATAAAYLNKQNYQVLILEKEEFPRFVIGESLLPACMSSLEEAGLLNAVGKDDHQIKSGASFYKGEKRCEFFFTEQYTNGWSWTWQVKREQFDQQLIDEAQRQGVEVKFNTEVIHVKISPNKQIVQYRSLNGEIKEINCKFIVDASGYGRVLPRLFDLNEPSDLKTRGSIFTHLIDNKRKGLKSNNISIHSFDNNNAWFWVIPFSDDTASVGIVSTNDKIEHYAKNNNGEFISFLKSNEYLKKRCPQLELLFEPRKILGYSIGIKKMHGEKYVLCGNSTEFLDPVFSSGVTLAINSGLLAAKLVNRTLKNEPVDWQTEYDDVLKKGIDVFRTYVEAWYDGTLETIFFSDFIDPKIKNQICSVLAGYIWDETNPFVKKHKTVLKTLSKVISM